MDKSVRLKIEEEEFVFDCRRVIYWPRRKILLAADLHWGKTHFLRANGIAISDNVFEEDLNRLTEILKDYETSSLLVLGDLIHHEKAIGKGLVDRIVRFRHENPCEIILIKGNHDRYTTFPPSWEIVEESIFYLDQFCFSHEYQSGRQGFQFAGHVHPMLRLRAGFDELRLPSFILKSDHCLLPAYSHLTGGQDVRLEKNQKAIVLMPEGLEVFEK